MLIEIHKAGKNSPMLRLTKFFKMLGWSIDDKINIKIKKDSLILSKDGEGKSQVTIKRYGGSMGIILTNPFYFIGVRTGYVRVDIKDDKLIIKKNKGTVIKF